MLAYPDLMAKTWIRLLSACASISVLCLSAQAESEISAADDTWRIHRRCGVNSLYVVAKLMGQNVSYDHLRTLLPDREQGCSLLEIRSAAELAGLRLSIVRGGLDWLRDAELPVIAHWEEEVGTTGHFVVVVGVLPEHVRYIDGTTGNLNDIPLDEFLTRWSGYAIAPHHGRELLPGTVGPLVVGGALAIAFVFGRKGFRRARRKWQSARPARLTSK